MNIKRYIVEPAVTTAVIVGALGISRADDSTTSPAASGNSSINQPATPSAASGTSPVASATVTGTVKSIDANASSMKIKDAQGVTQTIVVKPDTKITRDGMSVALSDLKKGDSVSIQSSSM